MFVELIIKFRKCPRCEDFAFERFKTHDYCLSCNFSTELDLRAKEYNVPKWALDSMKGSWVKYDFVFDKEQVKEKKEDEVAA